MMNYRFYYFFVTVQRLEQKKTRELNYIYTGGLTSNIDRYILINIDCYFKVVEKMEKKTILVNFVIKNA